MTTDTDPKNSCLNRLHGVMIVIGVVCAIAGIAGGLTDHARFMNAYLIGYILILGLSLGSLALVMMHHTMGGEYAYLTRRIFEAGAMSMPLVTILFIPIAIGAKHLFPWANPAMVEADKILTHQKGYMSWWWIRAIIYFGTWNLMALVMWFGSSKYDRTRNPWTVHRLQQISAFGLFWYTVSMSFACVDWVMIRELHWYSSILGFVVCVSQVLGAVALGISVLRVLRHSPSIGNFITPAKLNDLGNLFLTFTILWAYLSFAQLLIIWMGNTAIETPWYVRRGMGGIDSVKNFWQWIGLLLVVAHFFIPFFVLLGRNNKRNLLKLSTLAMFVLLMRVVDVFWWVGPTSLSIPSIEKDVDGMLVRIITWQDIVVTLGIFGIWFSYMLFLLKRRPLLARTEHGLELEGGAHHAHAAA